MTVPYGEIVEQLDDRVRALLPQQVMDSGREDFGGFVTDGVAAPTSVSTLSTLGYAYLLEGSVFEGSQEILARITSGVEFGRRVRRESGCFDLISTNFDSSPDTGFLVNALAPVVRAARKAEGDGAAQIADVLGEIIRVATPGMVAGGFHTPNHRWVLVSALAQALELFPDLDGMAVVENYLDETIDINEDGDYIERSAGVYNAVCNRSLRMAAEALKRPDLLEPVRRNLDLSYHMLHADGTVVTSFSGRQDRGQRIVLVNMADSYYYMARHDGNGFYAAVTDWLVAVSPAGGTGLLEPFLTHPEWRQDDLQREPLPQSYSKIYPSAMLWRVRRGRTSATTGAGITAPFSVRHGEVELTSVNLCASYFAIAQFAGETFESANGTVTMTHRSRGDLHDRPVYYQPMGEPVAHDEFYRRKGEREVYSLPPLETSLEVQEVGAGGFDLHVTCSGYDRVPFQIACDFAPGGEVDLDSGALKGRAGEAVLLKAGHAIYRLGGDAISVGPGAGYGHRFWDMRGSEPAQGRFGCLSPL